MRRNCKVNSEFGVLWTTASWGPTDAFKEIRLENSCSLAVAHQLVAQLVKNVSSTNNQG